MPASPIPAPQISLVSTQYDAFGRLRTSDPVTLFDSTSQYDVGPIFWQTVLTGSGASAHLPNESSVRLRTTTTTGDKALRQTRQYHRYQPGKSQFVLMTFAMGAAATNVRKRVGYFDDDNGIFLEQSAGKMWFVQRSKATGSVVDTKVEQIRWNVENGIRGAADDLELNFAKTQILFIDLEWLGVGRVRCGFVVDGAYVVCHEFLNANNLATVYMTTANLPLRYEIENTGTADSATNDLIVICSSVISEGGFEEGRGIPFAVKSATAGVAVTAAVPLLSIRPALTFNSIVNRSTIIPTGVDMMARNKSAIICIFYGATLTGASWTPTDSTHSAVEYDVSATAFTGGICIGTIYVPASSTGVNRAPGASGKSISSRLPLYLTVAGAHPTTAAGHPFTDSLTVVAQTAESPDASTVYADIQWQELR